MMTKNEALKMAIEAMERAEEVDWELNSLHVLNILQAIQACKEALEQPEQEVKCNPHPDAPHGFMRDESHSQDRYVCECEYWTPPAQEPVAWMHRHAGEITEFNDFQSCQYCEPLYTHPAPSWQGLSEEEMMKLANKYIDLLPNGELFHFDLFAHAIEQALKEKNNAV